MCILHQHITIAGCAWWGHYTVFWAGSWLVGSVIAGILVALGVASTDMEMYRYGAQRVSPVVAFFIFVAFVIGGIVTALPMLAFKDLVSLLVDLASDARRTADATTHLLSTTARPPQ